MRANKVTMRRAQDGGFTLKFENGTVETEDHGVEPPNGVMKVNEAALQGSQGMLSI